MASHKVEIISAPMQLGEGPHWDHDSQQLYFVDIFGKSVHRYDPALKTTTTVKFGKVNFFLYMSQYNYIHKLNLLSIFHYKIYLIIMCFQIKQSPW